MKEFEQNRTPSPEVFDASSASSSYTRKKDKFSLLARTAFRIYNMEASPSRRSTTVVCPEPSLSLWHRIQKAVSKLPDLTVLRCRANADDVLSLCRRLTPALLIADSDLICQFNRDELLDLTCSGELQVLALNAGISNDECIALLRAGCSGVLAQNSSVTTYRKAVSSVRAGQIWAPRMMLSQLVRDSLLADSPRRLTPRESEILGLLGQNSKNQNIADHLFISRETVRWHLRSLYSKIGVSDRKAAVEFARRASLKS
jgi:DNA-binding NarL/FixJ family response regulator